MNENAMLHRPCHADVADLSRDGSVARVAGQTARGIRCRPAQNRLHILKSYRVVVHLFQGLCDCGKTRIPWLRRVAHVARATASSQLFLEHPILVLFEGGARSQATVPLGMEPNAVGPCPLYGLVAFLTLHHGVACSLGHRVIVMSAGKILNGACALTIALFVNKSNRV